MTTTQASLDEQRIAFHNEAVHEYQTDYEQKHIAEAIRVARKELLERVRREVIGDDKDWRIQPTKEKTLSERAKWVLRAEQRMKLDAIEREL